MENPSRRHKHYEYTCTQYGSTKYIKKILWDFKKDIDTNTTIVAEFNMSLSKTGRSSEQNINKDIAALNNVPLQMELTDIYIYMYMYIYIYIYILSSQGNKIHKCTWNIFNDRPHGRTQNKSQ